MGEDTCGRASRYLVNLRAALDRVGDDLRRRFSGLIDAVLRYASDAEYYVGVGDCDTALAAVSYAEGLLDALKYIGVAEPEWPSLAPSRPRVFLAGTFDLIHPGHIELFRFAASLGDLYVVVARDSNVLRAKGKPPVLSERTRLEIVRSIRYVRSARLGDPEDKMRPVLEIRPDIIVLGPDQPYDTEDLARRVSSATGKRVRVVRFSDKREFEPGMRGSSDIMRRICCESYCRIVGCEGLPGRSS